VEWLTVPIFLSVTDGAKDTAEEFETVVPERRHLQHIQRAAVLGT
jgi:hypothetical protein